MNPPPKPSSVEAEKYIVLTPRFEGDNFAGYNQVSGTHFFDNEGHLYGFVDLEHHIKIRDQLLSANALIKQKDEHIESLEIALKVCKNDYWFMTNLIENYGSDKEKTLTDCVDRMKFRKPIFKILKQDEDAAK